MVNQAQRERILEKKDIFWFVVSFYLRFKDS